MARSRNIKPGFFENDLLAELSPLGRLLFIGLWTIADREGRFEDRPKKIKAQILPYDDGNVDELLNGLAERGFILRYCVDGMRFIQVQNWSKHQQPHIKEVPSLIPAPDKHGASTVQEPDRHKTSTEEESLIPDSLNLIPDSLNPSTATSATPPVVADVKTKKPAKPKGRDFTIAALELPEKVGQAFDRVWTGYPKEGWNFSTKRPAPRRINYAEASKRFYEVLQFCGVKTSDGNPIQADDLADATLAWVANRVKEARRDNSEIPNVPCIANFFSSVEGSKHHWKEALLEFFEALPVAS